MDQAFATKPDERQRSLHRVGACAERLESLNNCLQAFVDRYHGNPQGIATPGLNAPPVAGVPAGHIGWLSKVEDELGRLDRLVTEIGEIG